ncbi:hypothetical protein RHMOL_Rhmol08G0204700 [Rhododendron molle]|uniref:Uncharacterized protein n=1 Tax=Rhododendron molle TaxID=49168 RepID=A0ACC0MS03_RHOML|nr:hypothetical protein RHMOL_Rhmol08G0204700 [Rhododendron molle]
MQNWYLVESGGDLYHILHEMDCLDDSVEFDEDDHIDGGQYYDINEEEDGTGHDMGLFNLENSMFQKLCLADSDSIRCHGSTQPVH